MHEMWSAPLQRRMASQRDALLDVTFLSDAPHRMRRWSGALHGLCLGPGDFFTNSPRRTAMQSIALDGAPRRRGGPGTGRPT